jgi:hypothetical protein
MHRLGRRPADVHGRVVPPPGLPTEVAWGHVVEPAGRVVDVGRMCVAGSHRSRQHAAFIGLMCRLYLEMRAHAAGDQSRVRLRGADGWAEPNTHDDGASLGRWTRATIVIERVLCRADREDVRPVQPPQLAWAEVARRVETAHRRDQHVGAIRQPVIAEDDGRGPGCTQEVPQLRDPVAPGRLHADADDGNGGGGGSGTGRHGHRKRPDYSMAQLPAISNSALSVTGSVSVPSPVAKKRTDRADQPRPADAGPLGLAELNQRRGQSRRGAENPGSCRRRRERCERQPAPANAWSKRSVTILVLAYVYVQLRE